MNLQEIVTKRTGKAISQCSNEEFLFTWNDKRNGRGESQQRGKKKIILYFSRIPDRKIIIQQPDQSWNLWGCKKITGRQWQEPCRDRGGWAGTIFGKWWTWTSCSMFPWLYRYTWFERRRCWFKLPLRIIQTGIWEQSPAWDSKPMDRERELADKDR